MQLKLQINQEPIEIITSRFPGGESHLQIKGPSIFIDSESLKITVQAHLRSAETIIELLLLTDAVRRQFGAQHPIRLICPYFPYARQDRVCNPGEALSIRVMCQIINSQNFESVEIWDAHSDVTPALLDRAFNRSAAEFVRTLPIDNVLVVAPDAGAIKRAALCAKALGAELVRADKFRDLTTGAISGTVVYSQHVGDKNFLIVDDICDGGRTFVELAKKLRPLTRGKIILYITHGIFSRGLDPFRNVIDQIYVANPFIELQPPFLTTASQRSYLI